MHTETYTATYRGYTVSITRQDDWWCVNRVERPEGGTEEEMAGDSPTNPTERYDAPFRSREQAEAVAKLQLKKLVGETEDFPLDWTKQD
jgi:hypothetical protein